MTFRLKPQSAIYMKCQKVEALFFKILHKKNNIRDKNETGLFGNFRNKILFVFKKTVNLTFQ